MNLRQSSVLKCFSFTAALVAVAWSQPLLAQQFNLIVAGPQPNAAAQNALQQQVHRMLEPMLKVELSFVIRVTQPTDGERQALIAAAVKWLDQFADEFSKKQDRNEQQMWLQGVQRVVIGGPRDTEDPRETIQRGVAKLVAETLPDEKAAIYEKEADQRAEFERNATVANLVEQLDDDLILSPEQRDKITAALIEHWDMKWAPQLESFAIGRNYFLPVPNQWVRPELTAAQRKVFDELNNSSQRIIFGGLTFGFQGNDFINDVDLDVGAPATEKSPDASQPDAGDPSAVRN
jgi:hypothetical protein